MYVAAFEARLSAKSPAELLDAIKPGGIHLSRPKPEFSFHPSLVNALRSVVLTALFDGADFSHVTGTAGLAFADVGHEGYFQVDEGARAQR